MALDIFGPANAPNATTGRPADDRAFGVTDTWFKDCSSSVANDGTKLKAAILNSVIAFARGLVRMNGVTAIGGTSIVTEANNDDAMAVKAIKHLQQRAQPQWANVDSGGANAMAVTLDPAPPEYKPGMVINVRKMAAANTTEAVTINVNGLGAKTVLRQNFLPPGIGDLTPGQVIQLIYDGTYFLLLSPSGGDVVPRNAAVLSPGSGNWIAPAGVYRIFIEMVGGGGGGGGGGPGNGGSGGGAAPYVRGVRNVVPGQSIAYTAGGLGSGGGGGAGTAGGGGGTSSMLGMSSTGGGGGQPAGSSAGGASGSGGGGDYFAYAGGGTIQEGTKGGTGGGSYYGSGGIALVSGTSGSAASPGSGGGGGWNSQAGGAGADGVIIIQY